MSFCYRPQNCYIKSFNFNCFVICLVDYIGSKEIEKLFPDLLEQQPPRLTVLLTHIPFQRHVAFSLENRKEPCRRYATHLYTKSVSHARLKAT